MGLKTGSRLRDLKYGTADERVVNLLLTFYSSGDADQLVVSEICLSVEIAEIRGWPLFNVPLALFLDQKQI